MMRTVNKYRRAFALATTGVGLIAGSRVLAASNARMQSFEGKVVVVTGGSRGLGLVLSRKLIAEGAKVAICARDEEELTRAKRELEQHGDVFAQTCDLRKRKQVNTFIESVLDTFGRIDVLINNAGVIMVAPVEEMNLTDFEQAMDTHFWAPLYTTLAVMPHMKNVGGGNIVNISSIGGVVAAPHLLPYVASKFALVGLSEGLTAELAKDGIIVTTVMPGLMRTGSHLNALFKGQHRAEFAWFSIGDSLPISSVSAEYAADTILNAVKNNELHVIVSPQAKALARLHNNLPGFTLRILDFVNRLLPAPGGIGKLRVTGAASTSALSPSFLTALADQAAVENNELNHQVEVDA
jgi:NAD(P)-dependent dehydrogenase (short-subunit alcohol dehydrogenase family)